MVVVQEYLEVHMLNYRVPVATFLVCALIALPIASCVSPIVRDGEVGFTVGPAASLKRVQEGEEAMHEYASQIDDALRKLADGQATLAEALGEVDVAKAAMAAKAQAMQAEMEKALKDAERKIEDQTSIDWTTIILAALGAGGLGATGVGAAGAWRKKLLMTPPPTTTPGASA